MKNLTGATVAIRGEKSTGVVKVTSSDAILVQFSDGKKRWVYNVQKGLDKGDIRVLTQQD